MHTYTFPLSQAEFESKLAELEQAVGAGAIQKDGEGSGTVKHSGVEAEYIYDAAAGVLTVEVLHKPFLIPESAIEKKLQEWFKGEKA